MSGKTIDVYHSRVYMNAREQGLSQPTSAKIAEISIRTGQRIEAGTHQPNRGRPQKGRTVPDPLAEVWDSELEPMLFKEPRLKATTLYEYLQDKYPGQYPQVRRTLQRRVQNWKVMHGPTPEVMFELRHEPGMMGLSDFTELKGMKITIAGEPYEHLIYHYRLAYSGWQYAQIIEGGESFVALSEGLQNALSASGGAPKQHRTDSLAACYRNTGGKRNKPLTRLYDEVCGHYHLQPTRNNTGIAHENGAIESPHGHLKNRIKQAIYLRGSAEFTSVSEYQALIDEAVEGLNRQCQAKFAHEQTHLQRLPKYRTPDYEIHTVKVSRNSTIMVRCILYSVPSRLIGRRLELHLYHNRIVGYFGTQQVVELRRVRVTDPNKRRGRSIDYRHVISGLHRKPRAFLHCTWQQDLLPNAEYKQLWQQLKAQFPLDDAARLIVEALYIAATEDKERAVAQYLTAELAAGTLTLQRLKQQFAFTAHPDVAELSVTQHDLSSYDQLIIPYPATEEPPRSTPDIRSDSLPKLDSPAQAAETCSHARPLGSYRASSYATTMVLCQIFARIVLSRSRPKDTGAPQKSPRRSPASKRKRFYQL
ncbi:IS21 family transposase (plasmid) [Acaryochloris sp. CCMEE 5410]|nr:IS21 family transposase [Acaryochloris sp. CCMEE 5410]